MYIGKQDNFSGVEFVTSGNRWIQWRIQDFPEEAQTLRGMKMNKNYGGGTCPLCLLDPPLGSDQLDPWKYKIISFVVNDQELEFQAQLQILSTVQFRSNWLNF